MTAVVLETLLHDARRRALLVVLRSRPRWTLETLFELLERGGSRAQLLGQLTVGELLAEPEPFAVRLPPDGGPPIDRARLKLARQLTGEAFDALVREVLVEADGMPVAAAYLRARVGGPRWKLQSSLERLVAAGEVQRSGRTSGTRYGIVDASSTEAKAA